MYMCNVYVDEHLHVHVCVHFTCAYRVTAFKDVPGPGIGVVDEKLFLKLSTLPSASNVCRNTTLFTSVNLQRNA